jgi:integrase/recombinase XerC
MDCADNVRDKAIISLFADSGIRLNELLHIKEGDIDLQSMTVTVWGKGGKQRKAPFTKRTADLIGQVIKVNKVNRVSRNIWGLERRGIRIMLYRLQQRTGLSCNPHTFRRTFTSNLHRAGLDVEHIMRLGGWESLDMVVRYTRSVKFEESLRVYQSL